jgi:multiple sugar transport system ATP-binding protein
MAQISVERVSKSFKANSVLNDVSFSADTGEIVVVFGPSGAGKTVLLRLIAGVEDLDAGSISLLGKDVTHAPP